MARILIAEDSPDIRALVELLLAAEGSPDLFGDRRAGRRRGRSAHAARSRPDGPLAAAALGLGGGAADPRGPGHGGDPDPRGHRPRDARGPGTGPRRGLQRFHRQADQRGNLRLGRLGLFERASRLCAPGRRPVSTPRRASPAGFSSSTTSRTWRRCCGRICRPTVTRSSWPRPWPRPRPSWRTSRSSSRSST